MDIEATNYAVDADDACSECCTYPTLSVSVIHRADFATPVDTSFNFLYDTLYPNQVVVGDSFVIDRARFFISNIKLVRESGEEVGVIDTLELDIPSGNTMVVDDSFVKLDRDIFSARTVGTLLTTGTFTGLKFTLGLDEFLLETDPNSVPSGHPLSTESDVLNYDTLSGMYIPNLLIFRQDTVSADSLFLQINEPDTVELEFATPFELSRGFDVNITLRIDYMKWFEGVDVESYPMNDISTAIRQNMKNAFTVEEITSD